MAAGTATTNPAPNGLGTPSPGTFAGGVYTPSAAWLAQAKPAIFPIDTRDGGGKEPIAIAFVTSVANATFTAKMWQWDRTDSVWLPPKDNASFAGIVSCSTFIVDPGKDPIFFQLSSISSGTVAISFDDSLGRAL